MRVYVSGPMTGLPDNNSPAFDAEAIRLRGEGHFVISPAELSELFGTPDEVRDSFEAMYWEDTNKYPHMFHSSSLAKAIMEADLAAVRSCDAIYLLNGWETSRGAKRELAEAIRCGLQIMQEGEDEK